MDVVTDLPADAQSPEPVQQRERLLDDPAVLAQPGAVLGAATGDDGRDAHCLDLPAVLIVVVGGDQLGQQILVQPLPDSRRVPVA